MTLHTGSQETHTLMIQSFFVGNMQVQYPLVRKTSDLTIKPLHSLLYDTKHFNSKCEDHIDAPDENFIRLLKFNGLLSKIKIKAIVSLRILSK